MSFKTSLMRFTASFSEEDSRDILSSAVDCASTSVSGSIISTQIAGAKQNASDSLSQCKLETDRFFAHTPWFIKTGHYVIGKNFVKCEPIFTFFAPLETELNF